MNMNNLDLADCKHYIAECELDDNSHALTQPVSVLSRMAAPASLTATTATGYLDIPDGPQAAVVGSSLLAFTDSVTQQNREDIMDSFLFATLVANKAFNPETQNQLWYGKFNEVLKHSGWLSTGWSYTRYNAKAVSFTMDQVGLEILGSAVAAAALPGPGSAAALKVAGDAIVALKARDKPLRLFDNQSTTHNGANFRIGTCVESLNGSIAVAMGSVSFTSGSRSTTVLFWEHQSSHVSIFRAEDQLNLNSNIYSAVRQQIRNKLTGNAQALIEEFEI